MPLTASILCVAAIIVPLWFVLPENWTFQASALYGSLAVPGVLLSLYLIHLWAGRVRGPAWTARRLTVVPLILLTLASLELIRFRNSDVIWGAVSSSGCASSWRYSAGSRRTAVSRACEFPRRSGGSTVYPRPRASARGKASTTSLATRP